MDVSKLKLKVGTNEFEAEGPPEHVKAMLEAWRQLVAITPTASSPPKEPSAPGGRGEMPPEVPPASMEALYAKVYRREGEVISLSVLPRGESAEADAALLILLGQKVFNAADLLGGTWIKRGLMRSGLVVPRPDRVLGAMEGLVTRTGMGRAVQYRLTNVGLNRANDLVKELAAMVA